MKLTRTAPHAGILSLDDVLGLFIDEATSIGHLLERQAPSIRA